MTDKIQNFIDSQRWQDIDSLDKTKEHMLTWCAPMRWKPYKPQARKQGYPDGRWQMMNKYGGWDNCEHELDKVKTTDTSDRTADALQVAVDGLREVIEVYAGMEGFESKYITEDYLKRIIGQMNTEAVQALANIEKIIGGE